MGCNLLGLLGVSFSTAFVPLLIGVFGAGAGYILVLQSLTAWVKNLYPEDQSGQFEGVKQLFFVCVPMIVGPAIATPVINAFGVEKIVNGVAGMVPGNSLFLISGLVTLLALIAVVLSVLYDHGEFDGLRRRLLYTKAQKDENGCAQLYRYASDQSGSFASLDGSLVSVSMHQVSVLDETGKTVYEQTVKFQSPALVRGASCAAAYDVGGTSVYVLTAKGLACQVDTSGEILAVALNKDGYLTVTSNESGCKAAVRVYDASGQPVFAYRSADRFIMTAALADDSRTLAAVAMGQSSGVFTSYVVFYRINSESALTTTALTGSLVYDLIPMGSRFCAVMEEQLCFLDDSGEVRAAYSCGSDYLRRVDCGDGYAALLLGRYRNGTQHRLVTVDSDGQVMASLDVDGEVLSMSAAGRYIAVLFSDRMVIYDKTLAECARLDAVSEARQVLMRADGSAVLAGSTAASLYLP